MSDREQLVKPADCTCEYPRLIARNGCGHTEPCPVYERWAAQFPNLDPRRAAGPVSRCLWCHEPIPETREVYLMPAGREALRRFSHEAYHRLGEAETEPEAVAKHLCSECWPHVVALGERVAA